MGFSIFREMREQNRNMSLSKPCQYQNSILSSVIGSFNIGICKKKKKREIGFFLIRTVPYSLFLKTVFLLFSMIVGVLALIQIKSNQFLFFRVKITR